MMKFPTFEGINSTYKMEADNADIRKAIVNAVPKATEQTKEMAASFSGANDQETCKKIFDFLKNQIQYKADGADQIIRYPSALLKTKTGDCKSYSLLTAAILNNLEIPCRFVLQSFNEDPTPSHIYVETLSGVKCDAVWGRFNSEKPSTFKYYIPMNVKYMAGISGVKPMGNCGCSSNCNSNAIPTNQNRLGAVSYNSSKVRIGDDTIPAYHKTPFKEGFDNGLDWYRVRRQQDKGAPELSLGAKAEWRLKERGLNLFRGAMLAFIRANGGGIATSLYNAIFRVIPKQLPVPTMAIYQLNQGLLVYAKQIGYAAPTAAQLQQIKANIGIPITERRKVQVGDKEDNEFVFKDVPTGDRTDEEFAWNKVMGKGSFEKFKKFQFEERQRKNKLQLAYSIPAATEKAQKEYYDGMQVKWFWMGGNPEALTGAIIEGNQKSPRGRDANYMLMVAKTRGLKPKDIGLVIRGFTSGFAGSKFDWGSNSTYIFGTKQKGIGLTGAEVAAWVGANYPLIMTLLGVIGSIYRSIKGVGEGNEMQREIDKLLTEGYVYEKDYLDFAMPRPRVIEVKNFEIPTAEVDKNALIDVALSFATNSAKSQELKKEGESDKNTQDFLKKAINIGTQVQPKEGFTSVALVKIDPNDLGGSTPPIEEDNTLKAGFGNAVLPILIGVGVIMALNKSKK